MARWKLVGWDGWWTLLLSNLIVIGTLGATYVWTWWQVYQTARRSRSDGGGHLCLVLGRQLVANRASPMFRMRLDRAWSLFQAGQIDRVMVLGGLSSGNSRTEADVGVEYLINLGVPEPLLDGEGASRHTLENLKNARKRLGSDIEGAVLVTNRHHLARCDALARGMELPIQMCAAEEALRLDWTHIYLISRESVFVHWYHVGRIWSTWTGNHKSLSRIQ